MKIVVSFFILMFSAFQLSAGDMAVFVNLGFSDNGRYYMFGQHGYLPDSLEAYSDIYIVDVAANKYASDGVKSGKYKTRLYAGQSSDGAFLKLYEQSISSKQLYRISSLEKGRPLFIRIGIDNGETGKELSFQDYVTGRKYLVYLTQNLTGSGSSLQSSFFIDLSIEELSTTQLQRYTVGAPDRRRNQIIDYNIEQILLGPNNALVFLIAQTYSNGDIRYMVETVKIQ